MESYGAAQMQGQFRVKGLGFRVKGLGFRDEAVGLRV